ncbi:MAG: SGNH/GDSL hydrolase family protein [Gammaproteobacteria bacterium]|nr:SGNH/GDSL hydrolase family protein [Gammaproteobacteria bacterium]
MVCLILGDSIAVGTHQALAYQHTECIRQAKVGISSKVIDRYPVVENADTVVISAGSNDDPRNNNVPTFEHIRTKYIGKKVVWILPRNRTLANQVLQVARKYGDAYVDGVGFKSNDNLHPASYASMARAVKTKM